MTKEAGGETLQEGQEIKTEKQQRKHAKKLTKMGGKIGGYTG